MLAILKLLLCYDVIVRLSVTEVHWRILANLGSNSDPNLPCIVVAGRGNLNNISRYAIATARPSCHISKPRRQAFRPSE